MKTFFKALRALTHPALHQPWDTAPAAHYPASIKTALYSCERILRGNQGISTLDYRKNPEAPLAIRSQAAKAQEALSWLLRSLLQEPKEALQACPGLMDFLMTRDPELGLHELLNFRGYGCNRFWHTTLPADMTMERAHLYASPGSLEFKFELYRRLPGLRSHAQTEQAIVLGGETESLAGLMGLTRLLQKRIRETAERAAGDPSMAAKVLKAQELELLKRNLQDFAQRLPPESRTLLREHWNELRI